VRRVVGLRVAWPRLAVAPRRALEAEVVLAAICG
jgi:hypothetical protein